MTATSPPDHGQASRGGGPLDALTGLRALDLSDGIAGAYCAKLFADAGAEVVKIEPPSGHPLRQWSTSGSVGCDGDPDGALFRHLAAGQRSTVATLNDPAGRDHVLDLVAVSDVVIESFPPRYLDERGLGARDLHGANTALTVVSITPFGQQGPRHAERRSEFLLQALVGSLQLHGGVDGPPVAVGGQLGEWAAGAYAAAGALAARARTVSTGVGEQVDVSVFEALAVTFLAYPTLFAALPGGTRSQT
ncbi:MAG: CoA transferase, partial [Acidimicrobiales bacterium]